jgi:hypothetical protein
MEGVLVDLSFLLVGACVSIGVRGGEFVLFMCQELRRSDREIRWVGLSDRDSGAKLTEGSYKKFPKHILFSDGNTRSSSRVSGGPY